MIDYLRAHARVALHAYVVGVAYIGLPIDVRVSDDMTLYRPVAGLAEVL
jgi:hypothetical protein